MARPPRIEFAGAVYHVASRCEPGLQAFADDQDRGAFLQLLAQSMQRFDAQVLAYCLGGENFQLALYTRQANLSRLMRHLNGVYTQHHNRRHEAGGALFRGRFKAVLVDRETLLLDVCRYIELAPLREKLVRNLADWPWSSYRAHAGLEPVPAWLDADGLHGFVLGRPVRTAADRRRAAERYARLVGTEPELDLWAGHLRQQIFLGDEAFVARMLNAAGAGAAAGAGSGIGMSARGGKAGRAPRAPRPASGWNDWLRGSESREQALYRAHTEGGLSMTALAGALELSVSRISRLIAGYERRRSGAG
ncbi:MAG: transposase [Burkholderiaceae bacterium]